MGIKLDIEKERSELKERLEKIIGNYNNSNTLKKETNISNFIKNVSIYKENIPKTPKKLVLFLNSIKIYLKLMYESNKKI